MSSDIRCQRKSNKIEHTVDSIANGRIEIMILGILEILLDIWFVICDMLFFWKKKKRRRYENEHKINKKFMFYPITLFLVCTIIVGTLSGLFFLWYQSKFIFPGQTKDELKEISRAIYRYKDENGKLPEKLEELIGSNPVRKKWRTDSWNETYHYRPNEIKSEFILKSKGPDKELGTEDDIEITEK